MLYTLPQWYHRNMDTWLHPFQTGLAFETHDYGRGRFLNE